MKDRNKLINCILLVFFGLSLASCNSSGSYCKHLEVLANKPEISSQLRDWVKQNIVGKDIYSSDILAGGGMLPGYWYLTPFDWGLLGFRSDAQIHIVGAKLDRESGEFQNIQSIFFGERSWNGILIKVPGAEGYGVDPQFLIPVSGDISIVCRERD